MQNLVLDHFNNIKRNIFAIIDKIIRFQSLSTLKNPGISSDRNDKITRPQDTRYPHYGVGLELRASEVSSGYVSEFFAH